MQQLRESRTWTTEMPIPRRAAAATWTAAATPRAAAATRAAATARAAAATTRAATTSNKYGPKAFPLPNSEIFQEFLPTKESSSGREVERTTQRRGKKGTSP